MSKTLLFTTSFCSSIEEWNERVFKWFNYFTKSTLHYNKLLIVDDGSSILPEWNEVELIDKPFIDEPLSKSFIFHFNKNLGRPAHLDYPGWFRSFNFAARYALKFNYDKVIHIESDAYLLSERIFNYFNNTQTGWNTLWCHKHHFPETAIQLICKDQIIKYYQITQLSYDKFFKNFTIETQLPFTHINKTFIGDRYHEYTDIIPQTADYACQVKHNFKV